MHEELWKGTEFKLDEARFFLERMGAVLVPDQTRHPAYGPSMTRWQPDFYYYFDAFLGATRSVPDVIQKCFGWDPHSTTKWPILPDDDETSRRTEFQNGFTDLYRAFAAQSLSRARVGTFHWRGVPPVQTKAKSLFGQEFTGKPGQFIPSTTTKQFPTGTDPDFLVLFSKPSAVEPSWKDFTLEIPLDDGTTISIPLFEASRDYLESCQKLVNDAKDLCERLHGESKLTLPLALPRENRS